MRIEPLFVEFWDIPKPLTITQYMLQIHTQDSAVPHLSPQDIFTELDLIHYQHQRLGTAYTGVPGISIIPFVFSLLDSLFSRVHRIAPRAIEEIIVMPIDGRIFVTTHLENANPGMKACDLFAAQAENELETDFAAALRPVLLIQNCNHQKWKAAGGGIFRLIPQENPNSAPMVK